MAQLVMIHEPSRDGRGSPEAVLARRKAAAKPTQVREPECGAGVQGGDSIPLGGEQDAVKPAQNPGWLDNRTASLSRINPTVQGEISGLLELRQTGEPR